MYESDKNTNLLKVRNVGKSLRDTLHSVLRYSRLKVQWVYILDNEEAIATSGSTLNPQPNPNKKK